MTTGSTGLRGVRTAAAALLILTVAAAGCGRPDDEAWLRCLGFKKSSAAISVLEGDLNDGTSSTVDIELENSTLVVSTKAGTGILVSRVRVDYQMSGFSPPSADFPVNLYLSPPADGKTTTGTLTAFPLASKSLKQWLIDSGVRASVVALAARMTFYGLTNEGTQIETEASLGIALTNTRVKGTRPAVTIVKKADAIISGDDGGFTVTRTGSTSTSLTVNFTTDGDADDINDYYPIGTAMSFSPGSASATIPVIARSGGIPGSQLIVNLSPGASYDLGSPSTASVIIF